MLRYNLKQMLKEIKEDEKVKPAKSSILTQDDIVKLLKNRKSADELIEEFEQAQRDKS